MKHVVRGLALVALVTLVWQPSPTVHAQEAECPDEDPVGSVLGVVGLAEDPCPEPGNDPGQSPPEPSDDALEPTSGPPPASEGRVETEVTVGQAPPVVLAPLDVPSVAVEQPSAPVPTEAPSAFLESPPAIEPLVAAASRSAEVTLAVVGLAVMALTAWRLPRWTWQHLGSARTA